LIAGLRLSISQVTSEDLAYRGSANAMYSAGFGSLARPRTLARID